MRNISSYFYFHLNSELQMQDYVTSLLINKSLFENTGSCSKTFLEEAVIKYPNTVKIMLKCQSLIF